jgi:pilus assembly protein FimV
MKGRHDFDDSTGDSQLVKALGKGDDIDLNLDDFSAALHGGDTVEQPRSFGNDVFGDGETPVDLDVGFEGFGESRAADNDDGEPLDAQTMTEVGTKLDLARAYIDMGDPEGARSILEEVLDEGDPGQRREAQGLIEALSA